jgi:hypothetical protein
MIAIFRKTPDPELMVRILFRSFITEQNMWNAVCSFEPYTAPPSVTACETAFAHLGILQRVCAEGRSETEVARIAAVVGEIVEEGFAIGNEETSRFYRNFLLEDLPLGRVARLSVLAYYQRAFRPDLVARILCGRIGCAPDKTAFLEVTLREFSLRVTQAAREKIAA